MSITNDMFCVGAQAHPQGSTQTYHGDNNILVKELL